MQTSTTQLDMRAISKSLTNATKHRQQERELIPKDGNMAEHIELEEQWDAAVKAELQAACGNALVALVRAVRKHPALAKAAREHVRHSATEATPEAASTATSSEHTVKA